MTDSINTEGLNVLTTWPSHDPALAARIWANLADRTGQAPEDVRDIAAALGVIDQPVWQGTAGVRGKRERIK